MGFTNSSQASIEASLGQAQPNFSSLRKLIDQVYEPMTSSDFDSFLERARESGQHLSLAGADGKLISFTSWFDQLTKSKPEKNFITQLTAFSMQKMNEPIKDLVSFFKLDRFCELRSLFAALKNFPKAYLSRPNSVSDSNKADLVLEKGDQTFNIQVKAAKKKKAKTSGLRVLERVKDLELKTLEENILKLAV